MVNIDGIPGDLKVLISKEGIRIGSGKFYGNSAEQVEYLYSMLSETKKQFLHCHSFFKPYFGYGCSDFRGHAWVLPWKEGKEDVCLTLRWLLFTMVLPVNRILIMG